MNLSMGSLTVLFLCSCLLSMTKLCAALDTVSTGQSIRGNETMVSADGIFELGFFSPGDLKNRYLGIWYRKSVKTVVWVANRETPLPNSLSTLQLTDKGILVLLDHNQRVIWLSNTSRLVQNPVAQLLDSGNLVIQDANDKETENFLWQSFDYPCDTFLPGMKLGRNRSTGFDRFLTSWKDPKDPSPGNFTYWVDTNGYPQLFLSEGPVIRYRSGAWNGIRFSGMPNTKNYPVYKLHFVVNEKEIYHLYEQPNNSYISRFVLDSTGSIQPFLWLDELQDWKTFPTEPIDKCSTSYAPCGPYARCNMNKSQFCGCLSGFESKFHKNWVWDMVDWSSGCDRRAPLDCKGDVFYRYSDIKLPDTQRSWFNTSLNLEECKMICQKNCSCTAYANLDIRGSGSGCLLWFGDLIDIQEFDINGQDLYIRMASSESELSLGEGASEQKKKKQVAIIVSSIFTGMFVFGLIMCLLLKHKLLKSQEGDTSTKNKKEDLDLPLFAFTTIATATNNFSSENKLGEGGFGPVYKGVLKEGQEIAVKRLSRNSKQGLVEFRNEVICIAKLQHRNLVKLVGCCIQEEYMLLYEYMPNKSLDFFIFDQIQRKLLNWQKRFHIINGIARGLLYLHQDSRLRIVHRDLKASNILLDCDMNPKISDFGLARSFGGNETEANTNRVVGTYGYMPPEYAIDGVFSTKSDVFSYGVLVLEIVSGKKNRGFYHPDHYHNLLGHAWKLFKEGRTLELIDEMVTSSCHLSEVLRSIHISLLCVQRSPEDRPNMPSVVLMLGSENKLPQPKEPGFFTERDLFEAESWTSKNKACSVYSITQTMLSAR